MTTTGNNNDQESTSSISSSNEKQQEQALIDLRNLAENNALSSMMKHLRIEWIDIRNTTSNRYWERDQI